MKKTVINEYGETVVRMPASDYSPLTQEQINMIDRAMTMPYVEDEDCPPLDEELLKKMDEDIRNCVGSGVA